MKVEPRSTTRVSDCATGITTWVGFDSGPHEMVNQIMHAPKIATSAVFHLSRRSSGVSPLRIDVSQFRRGQGGSHADTRPGSTPFSSRCK
jgi:hypothetical protein